MWIRVSETSVILNRLTMKADQWSCVRLVALWSWVDELDLMQALCHFAIAVGTSISVNIILEDVVIVIHVCKVDLSKRGSGIGSAYCASYCGWGGPAKKFIRTYYWNQCVKTSILCLYEDCHHHIVVRLLLLILYLHEGANMPSINIYIDICWKINIFVLICMPLVKSSIDLPAASVKSMVTNKDISKAYCSSYEGNHGQWHFLHSLVLLITYEWKPVSKSGSKGIDSSIEKMLIDNLYDYRVLIWLVTVRCAHDTMLTNHIIVSIVS